MRSHYCGQINTSLLDQEVVLCGWVHRRRDHGGVIFIDLRDYEGLAQVVLDPAQAESFAIADTVRNEFVLRITGKVRRRPEGTVNPNLPTGEVEVLGHTIEILNRAKTLPFQLDDKQVHDDLKLRYRYIDLRRTEMRHNMQLRATTIKAIRNFLEAHHFLEVETPMLTRATPEGARDYLIPSRTHPGKLFALPQSPQLFKQLLMIAGLDRYYQIARCFRDEDLRADRQPEFTQLDIETSFMDETEITTLMENMLTTVFKQILNIELPCPFPRIAYSEAIRRFGSDRPDLRNPLEFVEVSDLMAEVEFRVFSGPAKLTRGRVAAMNIPGGNNLSRKDIDGYTDFVAGYGAKGLAYIQVHEVTAGRGGLQSPILKFLPDQVITTIIERTQAKNGDLILFGADKAKIVNDSLSALRQKLAQDLDLLKANAWRPVWVVDFPMFEYSEDRQRWDVLHHPFTAPRVTTPAELEHQPDKILSRAYDLVINGIELGGGSIRIHQPNMQNAVFKLLDIDRAEITDKFGFLIEALDYGCPPHGGIAFGLDRLIMMLAGAYSIRDVIAFPKTQAANCLLTKAPATVTQEQLSELGIKIATQVKASKD